MGKEELLDELATNGYNVGFGAKKHFATYDMIKKIPGVIGLVGLLISVGQLAYPDSPFNNGISVILLMASIVALTIAPYATRAAEYEKNAVKMTKQFNKLRRIYLTVKSSASIQFEDEVKEMNEIMDEFYKIAISEHIFGSDWFTHYKFFSQHQIDWIDERKRFKFLKDKVPTSFIWFIVALIIVIPLWIYLFKGALPFVG